MVNETPTETKATPNLRAAQVYAMAGVCVVAGLGFGYLLRRPQTPAQPAAIAAAAPILPGGANAAEMPKLVEVRPLSATPTQPPAAAVRSPHTGGAANGGRMPSLEEMKHMADKQAAPLLEQLKSKPNDSALLAQVANLYYDAQVFPVAVD